MFPGVSASETTDWTSFDAWTSSAPESANGGGFRLASVEPAAVEPAAFVSTDSFDQRFASAVDWPDDRPSEGAALTDGIFPSAPTPDWGGRADARRAGGPSNSPLPRAASASPPASAGKRVRLADLPPDSSQPTAPSTEEDDHTAIYDISAHVVYLPNGQRLEAHSGLGGYLDDPRYIHEKDRGPTPPNVYDLTLREQLFHGVRAIRLNPVGGGNMYGRDGILAHTFMLGPNGQSNGCVSFRDYPAFLNAYLNGEINRLVVVEHLASKPNSKTASGWIPESIKALFRRS